MGLMTTFKARKAVLLQQQNKFAESRALYDQAYAEGLSKSAYLLAYSVLLLRQNEGQKALEVLRRAETCKDLKPDQKPRLNVNYAVALWKTGEHDRAIRLLEEMHRSRPRSDVYNVLGFLYVEAGSDKALDYCREAVDYDDTDPVSLDNLAQAYYRVAGDKQTARGYFDRAIQEKPGQIDTLYYLSRYDLDEGKYADAAAKLQKALDGRFSPLNCVTPDQVKAELERVKALM